MRLQSLIEGMEIVGISGSTAIDIRGISEDSRVIRRDDLFVALRGLTVDGYDFIGQALSLGAVAVVTEQPISALRDRWPATPVVQVNDSRRAAGTIARRFYNDPSMHLTMLGVTGTNGKTTVSYLIRSIFNVAGNASGLPAQAGVIGTIAYDVGSQCLKASHTTPSAVTLQDLLHRMVHSGVNTAVLEVTSHSLALSRIEGCVFDTVVFTNLTRDHLDFHADLDAYFRTKLRLFSGEFLKSNGYGRPARALVNFDDQRGMRVLEACRVPAWGYAIEGEADIRAHDIHTTLDGTTFTAATPLGKFPVRSALVGCHNVSNLLAAIGVGLSHGLSKETIQHGIESLDRVPGRFETIDVGQDFTVVVDYAHTGDALDHLLRTASSLKRRRLITVFGCGGDRDRGKRPIMGRVAATHSDYVVLTSDNPRTEDPSRIIEAVEQGVQDLEHSPPYAVIPDRREAIVAAITEARAGDLVVIAGKGHEDYQIIGTTKLPFDDRVVAREAILNRQGIAC